MSPYLPLPLGGLFRIVVLSHLDKSFSASLDGMQIETTYHAVRGPTTHLLGYLRDQAELNGVLNWLCDQNHLVLSVESLDGLRVDQLTDETAGRSADR